MNNPSSGINQLIVGEAGDGEATLRQNNLEKVKNANGVEGTKDQSDG